MVCSEYFVLSFISCFILLEEEEEGEEEVVIED